MNATRTPRTPVEDLLDSRRRHLRLTWKDVHTRAGLSHQTVRLLRTGDRVAQETEDAIEDALGLARGSIAEVRKTGDPSAASISERPPSPPAASPRGRDGAEWLDSDDLPGGGTRYRLTRIIDGRPAAVEIVDFDATPRESIRAELREVMDEAAIRQHRRLRR